MSVVAMSGADTISLNNRNLADLATGDCVMLSFPNELASIKTGKNGNAIYGFNESGRQSEVTIRVVRGSADDKFLNSLLAQQLNNPAAFPLMIGQFIKQIGDGAGNVTKDTYNNSGGIFAKWPEAKSNVEGDEQQSIAEYKIKFSNSPRTIG